MFLVELVMQGVRGIRELARLRFQGAFNIVSAGNESGKTTAADTMQRLLFPDHRLGGMDTLVSRQTPDASRGALVLHLDDGSYYRVIQDFSKQAINLSKYDPASKEFRLIYKDWSGSAEFLSSLTAGITEEDFDRVFVFRREHFDDGGGGSAPVATAASVGSARQPTAPGRNASATDERLAELRETLRKAEEAADADYRHQSAKLALDELKKKLSSVEEIDGKSVEIDASLAELKGCEKLPENLGEMLDEHERRMAQKMADEDELYQEIDGLKARLAEVPAVNILTDKLFIIGALLGILSVLAAIFVLTAEYRQYFPVGVIVALVLIAVGSYNASRKNAQRRAVRREIEAAEEDLLELEKKFVHDGSAVATCMRATGATTLGELKEQAQNYRYFLSLREDNEENRRRILGDRTPDLLQQEYDRQQEEVLKLEKAATALAQYAVDTYSVRQDIERLEAESGPGEQAWGFGGFDTEVPVAAAAPAVTGQGEYVADLAVASKIGGIEMETLIPAVEAAAQRNLTAVSGGKYVRIEVGHGGPPLIHGKDDRVVGFAELSHGTKALIYFCFRTGLVEALAGKRRLPFILDDALSAFDPARQQAACQILRVLGKKTQVILFTSNPALKAAGDVAAELK